jgi:hypothetical protein
MVIKKIASKFYRIVIPIDVYSLLFCAQIDFNFETSLAELYISFDRGFPLRFIFYEDFN